MCCASQADAVEQHVSPAAARALRPLPTSLFPRRPSSHVTAPSQGFAFLFHVSSWCLLPPCPVRSQPRIGRNSVQIWGFSHFCWLLQPFCCPELSPPSPPVVSQRRPCRPAPRESWDVPSAPATLGGSSGVCSPLSSGSYMFTVGSSTFRCHFEYFVQSFSFSSAGGRSMTQGAPNFWDQNLWGWACTPCVTCA